MGRVQAARAAAEGMGKVPGPDHRVLQGLSDFPVCTEFK